ELRLLPDEAVAVAPEDDAGAAELLEVVGRLVERARAAGALRPDVSVSDVLLVIATAAPSLPDAAPQAAAPARLLAILRAGRRSRPGCAGPRQPRAGGPGQPPAGRPAPRGVRAPPPPCAGIRAARGRGVTAGVLPCGPSHGRVEGGRSRSPARYLCGTLTR